MMEEYYIKADIPVSSSNPPVVELPTLDVSTIEKEEKPEVEVKEEEKEYSGVGTGAYVKLPIAEVPTTEHTPNMEVKEESAVGTGVYVELPVAELPLPKSNEKEQAGVGTNVPEVSVVEQTSSTQATPTAKADNVTSKQPHRTLPATGEATLYGYAILTTVMATILFVGFTRRHDHY